MTYVPRQNQVTNVCTNFGEQNSISYLSPWSNKWGPLHCSKGQSRTAPHFNVDLNAIECEGLEPTANTTSQDTADYYLSKLSDKHPRNQQNLSLPKWNKNSGILSLDGALIKQVKKVNLAINVVKVLDVFEEEKWPESIDDPLGDGKNQKRLHETIASLNKNLERIKFYANGRGDGFQWKRLG